MTFFERPELFLALIAAILLFLPLAIWEAKGQRVLAREINVPHNSASARRKIISKFALCFVTVSLLTALAATPLSEEANKNDDASGEIIFDFDKTPSVEARISPTSLSKMERSKDIALRLFNDTQFVKAGVCVFSEAHTCFMHFSQLTSDKKVIRSILEDFIVTDPPHSASSDIIGSLKSLAEDIREHYGENEPVPLVVVFTDGEETISYGEKEENIAFLRNSGIKFALVGVGEREGAKIPIFSSPGVFTGEYEQYKEKDYVSFLKEDFLRDLAAGINGEYFFEDERGKLDKYARSVLPETPQSKVQNAGRENIRGPDYRVITPLAFIAVFTLLVFSRKYIF